MDNWINAIGHCQQRNQPFVLVTLLAVRGSTPRNADSKIVVTPSQVFDSIGGGNLEHQATIKARKLLGDDNPQKSIEEFSLGASLGQCCGGHATLLFEPFSANPFNVVLFGAGHVASALVKILSELPCTLHWYDSREAFVEQHTDTRRLAFHDAPESLVDTAPAGTSFLIMTHDHALDFVLCGQVLDRHRQKQDVEFCGLIGSNSKAAKFRKRLAYKGFDSTSIGHLQCPVGLVGIPGKHPMQIAVSIAAELIQRQAAENTPGDKASDDKPSINKTQASVPREQLLKLIRA